MLGLANAQRRHAEPVCGLAVLIIHDAIEIYLNLACEVNGGVKSGQEFMALIEGLERATNANLQHKEGMRRLNKSRVNAKHYGTFPTKADLRDFAETAEEFLRASCEGLFGHRFEVISMVVLVENEEIRVCLEAAVAARNVGDLEEALTSIAEAYARLERTVGAEPQIRTSSPVFRQSLDEMIARQGSDVLVRAVGTLSRRVWALENGIDRRELQLFSDLTPIVGFSHSGKRFVQGKSRRVPLKEHEVEYCFDFVLRTVLQLQDASAVLPQVVFDFGRLRLADV